MFFNFNFDLEINYTPGTSGICSPIGNANLEIFLDFFRLVVFDTQGLKVRKCSILPHLTVRTAVYSVHVGNPQIGL